MPGSNDSTAQPSHGHFTGSRSREPTSGGGATTAGSTYAPAAEKQPPPPAAPNPDGEGRNTVTAANHHGSLHPQRSRPSSPPDGIHTGDSSFAALASSGVPDDATSDEDAIATDVADKTGVADKTDHAEDNDVCKMMISDGGSSTASAPIKVSSLPTAVWGKIYELLNKSDLDAIEQTSIVHRQGVEDFINRSVDSYPSYDNLPKMALMKRAGTTVHTPLWREQLVVEITQEKTTRRLISKQRALYPRIVYRHILLQRETLCFNQVSPGVEMKHDNSVMTMCGNGASLSSFGFGASTRWMVPGCRYTVTATFEYEHSHPRTQFGVVPDIDIQFGIVRPTCHRERLGLGVRGEYESPWILESYPQKWKPNRERNAVLFTVGKNIARTFRGTAGAELTNETIVICTEEPVEEGTVNVVMRQCPSCQGRKQLKVAYFELDLTDKSDGKLSLLAAYEDPEDSATIRYRKHQLASGLEGEFVWAGHIEVWPKPIRIDREPRGLAATTEKWLGSIRMYDGEPHRCLAATTCCGECLRSNRDDSGANDQGPSFDEFIRIMAAANEDEIPPGHSRAEMDHYLGSIINNDNINTTKTLRSSLGVAFAQRLGRLNLTAGHTAFIFRRNRELGGNAETMRRRLTDLNGSVRSFRLSKLKVIYDPEFSPKFLGSALVRDLNLTMHSSVMELLEMTTTEDNAPPPIVHDNVTDFVIQLQGQPEVVANRLQDIYLYQIIVDIANLRPGRLWLRIVPRIRRIRRPR